MRSPFDVKPASYLAALTHESEETDWMGHAAGRLKKTFAKKG